MPSNKTQKKQKGGGWGFESSNNKIMKYPLVNISYGTPPSYISCDICKKFQFYSINISVPRSKISSILFDDISEFISHPLKMYTCVNCNNCKFIYQSTRWNGIANRINETK